MMKQPQPFFSIIIPTYGRPDQLALCLQALRRLDYPRTHFEVVVVNDGWNHPLEPVTTPFRDDLNLTVLQQPNAGPAAARNFGAAHAKGEFFAFTDDDCMPATNWLLTLAERFRRAPEHLIGGRTLIALSDNMYSKTSQAIIEVVYAYYNSDPARASFFASNNLAAPADRFRTLGGFDPTFRTSEDRDFCDRWLHRGYLMTYAPDVTVHHAHPLRFGSFWNQHFAYGRGAWRYHTARAQRGSGQFRPELKFYMSLLRYPFVCGRNVQAARMFLTLLLAQTANAAGFFRQWITQVWPSRVAAE
ncbi:MAG: glycosyltransferase family 2 protein [Nitrospiraceae bacterium]